MKSSEKPSSTKETVKHAAVYSIASILGKLLGFIMLPFYAHNLGTEGYGIIGMMDAATILLVSLMAYGFQAAIIRFYHEQEEERKKLAISSGYWIVVCITAFMTITLMLFSSSVANLLFGDSALNLIVCMALLAFFLDMSGQTAGTILLIRRQSALFSLIGLIRLLTGLTLNIILIVWLKLGVYGYFLSSATTALISFIIFQHISFKECGMTLDKKISRDIIRYQIPLVPGSLVSFASLQSETIFMRFLESIEKVGILEMAYKFPSLMQLIIHGPIMNSWNTERIRIVQEDIPDARKSIGLMFTLSLFILSFSALLIASCIGDLLILLTPESFWKAKTIAQIECLSVLTTSMVAHANFGYLYTKDSKAWATLQVTIGIFKVGTSYLFISMLGLLGAAYSGLLAAIITFIFATHGGQKRYKISYKHSANISIMTIALFLFTLIELNTTNLLNLSTQAAAYLLNAFTELEGLPSELIAKLPYVIDMGLRASLILLFLPVLPFTHPPTKQWIKQRYARFTPTY